MKRKVLDVQKLIDDLYRKSGEAYDFGYVYVGDDYKYGFIHCVNYLDVTMEDYDGYDDFGDEDNQLYIDCNFRRKHYEVDDSNNNIFISHSIKMKDIFKDNATNKIYINPNAIKDWKVFKKIGEIDNYCYYCTDSKENEQSETISITESEIIFLYDLMRNTNSRDNKELFKKIKRAKDRINNKDLSDAFNSNGWGFGEGLKFKPVK